MSDVNFLNVPFLFLGSGKGLGWGEVNTPVFFKGHYVMIRTGICPELYLLLVPSKSSS